MMRLWLHWMFYCKYGCVNLNLARYSIKLHQNSNSLWIPNVLNAAIKPTNGSRLLSGNNGCHLWSVTDTEGKHRREARLWAQYELQDEVKIIVNHTSILTAAGILSVNSQTAPALLIARSCPEMWRNSNLSTGAQRVGHLSRNMEITGSIPNVCSLHI